MKKRVGPAIFRYVSRSADVAKIKAKLIQLFSKCKKSVNLISYSVILVKVDRKLMGLRFWWEVSVIMDLECTDVERMFPTVAAYLAEGGFELCQSSSGKS